jgi:type III pantothenate kinase
MPNLVIDAGNSTIKIAVFKQDEIVFSKTEETFNQEFIEAIAHQYQCRNIILSSVRDGLNIDETALALNFNYHRFSSESKIPVKNNYLSPKTLGLDRLAAVIGAHQIYKNKDVLVIDAGTCITYDMINKEGIYFGGSISAGINMRLKAMHQFTSKLPLVPFDESFDKSFGQNSSEAILSGVLNGVWFEAKGFLEAQQTNNFKVILCGGDAPFFDTRFKNSIFAHLILHEPNLVLIGLNTVVKYQHDHN